MKKIILIIGVSLSFISCSPKNTEVIETMAETKTKSEAVLAMSSKEASYGKVIYEEKCQRCHKLKTVTDYSKAQWANILPNMAKKSNLDESQNNFS
jgi:cytochrome c5